MPTRAEIEELAAAKEKIKELLRQDLPAAAPAEVSVRAGDDFAGEKSLFVQVLQATSPAKEDIPRQLALRRKFQLWLLEEFGDERFPYFEFLGRADLEERAQGE